MWNKILSISVEIRDFRSEDEEWFLYTSIPPRRADSETLHVGAVQCTMPIWERWTELPPDYLPQYESKWNK